MSDNSAKALEFFADQIQRGILEYRDGEIWRVDELPWARLDSGPYRVDFITNRQRIIRQVEHGVMYTAMVGRLVWRIYHGVQPIRLKYRDKDPTNTRIENLSLPKHYLEPPLPEKVVSIAAKRGRKCKLSDDEIRMIRMYRRELPQREVAEMFNVTQAMVSLIQSRRKYGQVEDIEEPVTV